MRAKDVVAVAAGDMQGLCDDSDDDDDDDEADDVAEEERVPYGPLVMYGGVLTDARAVGRRVERLRQSAVRRAAAAAEATAEAERTQIQARAAGRDASFGTKLDAVVAVVRQLDAQEGAHGGKAVIFSQWRATLELVGKALEAAGVGYVTLQGQKALKTVQHTFASDPACRAFLLHAGSAAAGLTLVVRRCTFTPR
jgi:hypothetical protein